MHSGKLTLGLTYIAVLILCFSCSKQQLKLNEKSLGMIGINYLGKETLELNWFSPHLSIDWTAGSVGKVKIAGQQIQLVKYDTSLSKQTWFGS